MDDPLPLLPTPPHEDLSHSSSVLARVLSGRHVNHKTFQATLYAAWRPTALLTITHIESNTFSCNFQAATDLTRVLNGGPWSFRGDLVILQRWPSDQAYDDVDFSRVEF